MKVGYIRVSSIEQNPDRQKNAVKAEKYFIDYASGKNQDRPELKHLLDFVREGDEVIVHSMDRLARNILDLRQMVDFMTAKNVSIHFVKENLTFTGDDSPFSTMMLNLIGAIAEFERSLIKERQREGIELAKKKGKYLGRKPALSETQITEIRELAASKVKITEIAKVYGICRSTVYNYLLK